MNYKKLVTNALVAFSAQGISLVVSFVMSLLVPKVLGVTSYGYWQLFIFYAGYSGFFHFGLNDGVYLVEGGKTRNEINKVAINSQFRVAVLLQVLVGIAFCILSIMITPEEERAFVIYAFSLYTVISNLQLYLGYVFQAMNETRLFSFSTMLDRLVFLVPLIIFVVLRLSDFRPYIILYCLSRFCALVYCCWHSREFFKAGVLDLKNSIRLAASSIKIGFGLMLANVANILILGIARALVDCAWGIEAFGNVSFSLSIVNFFTSFVSQASMVLFPALMQGSEDERRSFYQGIRDSDGGVFPSNLLVLFPNGDAPFYLASAIRCEYGLFRTSLADLRFQYQDGYLLHNVFQGLAQRETSPCGESDNGCGKCHFLIDRRLLLRVNRSGSDWRGCVHCFKVILFGALFE